MTVLLTLIGVLIVSFGLKWTYDAGYKKGFNQRWHSEVDFTKQKLDNKLKKL